MFQERKSHTGLKLTGWVNYDRIDIFEWTVALRRGGSIRHQAVWKPWDFPMADSNG